MKTHVIDGVTYVEVKRKADVGDTVIDLLEDGGVRYCIHADRWGDTDNENTGISVDNKFYEANKWHEGYGLSHGDYIVIEPLESEEVTVDGTQASEQVIEMLANLARRVTQLESQLADTQRNVERQAEELENAKHLAESNEQDIAMLDERTHQKPAEETVKAYYARMLGLRNEARDKEYYEFCNGRLIGIKQTLDLLGFKLEGVNA